MTSAADSSTELKLKAIIQLVIFPPEHTLSVSDRARVSEVLAGDVGNLTEAHKKDLFDQLVEANLLSAPEMPKLAKRLAAQIEDRRFITDASERHLQSGLLQAAEILFERRCVLAAKTSSGRQEHIDTLLRLAAIYQRQGKSNDAREARRAVAVIWEQSGRIGRGDLAENMLELAQICFTANDTPEAERFAKKALTIQQSLDTPAADAVIECLRLMHEVAVRQSRRTEAEALSKKIERLLGEKPQLDEIERALTTYVNLPTIVDLTLRSDGITLQTSDFPRLIFESTGLDLRQYFSDAFKDADFLAESEKKKLVDDLFNCFATVSSFVSSSEGGTMERSEVTVVHLPPTLSQGFVQKMTVDKVVKFRLSANLPDDATFKSVSGITFNVGGKLIGLSEFNLKAVGSKCIVTPILAQHGQLPSDPKNILDSLRSAGKDLLVGAAMKMGKVPPAELPIVLDEFRQCLRDALNFKILLQEPNKDLVMFIERSAGIRVEDPLTRALLLRGMRVLKNDQQIELQREDKSICDLGGLALEISPTIKLKMAKHSNELKIEQLVGIGVEVPFDPPVELIAIGVDLKRALPRKIISLDLGSRDDEDRRRLVVCTGPACWMSLDLNAQMQPATDARGNWVVVGVTSNPISGVPQKFFLRLDSQNNLNMTRREIAEVVTQTAVEGFDPGDPFTWKWGAIALGGHALLTAGAVIRGAAGDSGEVKKTARKIGRFIGKLLNDL